MPLTDPRKGRRNKRPRRLTERCCSTAPRRGQGIERSESAPMQGDRTLPGV
jgi:hypothetical protein